MEQQFCIHWPAIIEEAKQRRKSQHLTQAKLATLASVSTPTLSRFERGEKDIQLSTVLRILAVLGIVDYKHLIFPTKKARIDKIKRVITFMAKDNHQASISCAITFEALEDYFHASEKNFLKIFQAHREKIQHAARRKYLENEFEKDRSILLRTQNI